MKKYALLCGVHILPDEDISLLFSTLVVLPQDKAKEEPTEQETTATTAAESTKEVESTPATAETPAIVDTPILAEEPKPTYEKVEAFAILTAPKLKESYEVANSPFIKILTALGIPQSINVLTTESNILDNAENYKCLWCIGLDIQTEKKALGLKHPNLLTSPDVLSLTTNEEKKAMYTPLKAFVATNMELISKK